MSSIIRPGIAIDNSDAYSFQKDLGEGAFGVVKHVKHNGTGKHFAVKEFKAQMNPQVRKSIEKEIEVLKNIGFHQNIVQLFDVLEAEGKIGLVLEYCELGDLDHYIREHDWTPIPPLMGDMIQGLRFLHGKDIAHRDLKPANILLVSSSNITIPTCKIADFGFAKFLNTPFEESLSYSSPPGSYLSTYCGTDFYMAPEVRKKSVYKKSCDIFSLGAIFFVLYSRQTLGSGRQAYLAPTINGKQLDNCTDLEVEEAVGHLEVQEGFRKMINKMLKQDSKERPNMEEVFQMYKQSKSMCNLM